MSEFGHLGRVGFPGIDVCGVGVGDDYLALARARAPIGVRLATPRCTLEQVASPMRELGGQERHNQQSKAYYERNREQCVARQREYRVKKKAARALDVLTGVVV
jgi:Zn-finger nucleic acid-binding protein